VALTGFVAFILSARQKTKEASIAFVLNLPVDGMPADRDRRILQEIVGDPGRFIRYLMFILAEEDDLVELALRPVTDGNGGTDAGWGEAIPLLEELVRAYSRHPEKIDRISRLVEDIKQAEGAGRRILPLGFEGIWNVFLLARGEGTQT
jgi:hypothetical protein